MGDDFPTKGRPSGRSSADPPWVSAPIGVSLPIAVTQPKPASSTVESQPAPQKRSWLGRLVVVLLLSLGVLGFYEYATLPDPRGLIDQNPETTALIRTRDQAAQSQGKKPRRRQYWVSLGSVAPRAVDAVIASEDASFFIHHGVDFDEMKKAMDQAWEKGSLGRGASTITQQLAKNLWLSGDRSLLRKGKELILARHLEGTLPKKRILELYLNVVEWGDGVYGIEAGSREHFGISASQLSVGQGAVLAAMLPSPRRWTPERHSRALRKRALWIVDRLEEARKISADEADLARSDIEQLLAKDRTIPEAAEEPDQAWEEER
jgi:monofunctional glycosyltransferase